jgi:hypothetical protein
VAAWFVRPRVREVLGFILLFAILLFAAFSVSIAGSMPRQRIFISDLLLETLILCVAIALLFRKLTLSKAGWWTVAGAALLIFYAAGLVAVRASTGITTTTPFMVLRVMVPAVAAFLAIDTGIVPRRGVIKAMVACTTTVMLLQASHWLELGAEGIRLTIFGSSINYFLACSSLMLFASIYTLLHASYRPGWRLLAYLNATLFTFFILIAGSRTAFGVACAIALFFSLVMLFSRRKALLLRLLLCVAAGVGLAFLCYRFDVADSVDLMNRILSMVHLVPTPDSVAGSDFVRWDLWNVVIRYILKTDGFFGGGKFLFATKAGGSQLPPHNFILELLVTIGIPGLIVFLGTVGAVLRYSLRNTRGWRNFIAVLFPSLIFFGYGFFHPFVSTGVLVNILFWCWLGIGLKHNAWKWERP